MNLPCKHPNLARVCSAGQGVGVLVTWTTLSISMCRDGHATARQDSVVSDFHYHTISFRTSVARRKLIRPTLSALDVD